MEQAPFKILFEDDEFLVIDKPAGITVNRSDTTKEDTVQDWTEKYLHIAKIKSAQDILPGDVGEGEELETDFYNRGGIVHRLDKETSGVLVLAKTPKAFAELQRQFKERLVQKKYTALAHGLVTPGEGEIKAPVGRLPWSRKQFGIVAGGRDSITFYKRSDVYSLPSKKAVGEKVSLLELTPHTGRTHQIRVHLKYIGHPIFADFLYAGRKTARDDRRFLPRVFLHAQSLSLLYPSSQERMIFTAPLPSELALFLQSLARIE